MTLQRVRLVRQIRTALEAGTAPPEAFVYLFFADTLHFANGAALNSRWLLGDPESELFEVGVAVFISQTLDASISMDDREAAQAARHAFARKGQVMEQLLLKYPHNTELLAYHVRENVLTGNVSRVVELLAQAPVEAEEDNRFWRFKGWVHAQRGEVLQAERGYRRAIELQPLDWGTRHLLAELLQQQQRFEEVEQLRELVDRANVLRRALHAAPSALLVPRETLVQLASYAADCGETQMADALRRRIQQHHRASFD
jgi:tetratricopeptide (TPR) repeat protein